MPQHQEKSNGTPAAAVNDTVKQHRYSLQHQPNDIPLDSFRHTQSHRWYDSKGRKKPKKATILGPIQPTINEDSDNDNDEHSPDKKSDKPDKKPEQHVFTIENEKRISRTSKKSERSMYIYENGGYDSMDKRSIASRAGSSRQPSLQSLEVVREQYCCCAKRTRCEKQLLLTVTVLSIVIIVLVIVLSVVASNRNISNDLKTLTSSFKSFSS